MNIQVLFSVFICNYFSIFYILYSVKEYNSIQDYPGFFAQLILLFISFVFYFINYLKNPNLKINFTFYFFFQITFLIYTLLISVAVPQFVLILNESYSYVISYNHFIPYLCTTLILSLVKLRVLYKQYKEEHYTYTLSSLLQ